MGRFVASILLLALSARAEAPVPVPAPTPSFCHNYPCSPGCAQEVSCEDYDPRRDTCSNPTQVLVGWSCSAPCSCAGDGSVVCSVSYRCVDMAEEMQELRQFRKPEVELAQPLLMPAPSLNETQAPAPNGPEAP